MKKSELAGCRIIVVGGSSGGHIMPVAAVAGELLDQGAEILWIGDTSLDGLAEQTATEIAVGYRNISAGKLRRYLAWANVLTPFQTLLGCAQAYQILRRFRPAVVFSKGGHVGLPVVIAAAVLKIPVIIHESDSVMGLANHLSCYFADRVCLTVPPAKRAKLAAKFVVTGLPVRRVFAQVRQRLLPHRRPKLLVSAGSQGSEAINAVVRGALPDLTKLVDITHVTGRHQFSSFASLRTAHYTPIGFADNMPTLISQADLVVTRSSATTLAELALVGRPAILIPLPLAANNHSVANAEVWAAAGAGIVLAQSALTPTLLVRTIQALISEPGRLQAMAQAAGRLANPNAARAIAQVIAEVLRHR